MRRFLKKSFTNSKNNLRILLFFMLYKSRLCVILLNALFLSKLSSETILLLVLLYIVYIFFVISCKIVFVNLYLRAFI